MIENITADRASRYTAAHNPGCTAFQKERHNQWFLTSHHLICSLKLKDSLMTT
jgi:hypothetical protein